MSPFNPFAPMTPDQEAAIHALLLATKGRLSAERIRRQMRGIDAGEAARLLARLRNEPEPPRPERDAPTPLHTPQQAAELRERLRAGYAGRAMQPVGLSR